MKTRNSRNSVKIVEDFWAAVWKARNPDAIDRFVDDDFVITTGGVDVVTRDGFKEWAWQFLEKITDLGFEVVETFQNEDGSRVASRWRVTGKNNGILGTVADQRPIGLFVKGVRIRPNSAEPRYAGMPGCDSLKDITQRMDQSLSADK